MINFVNTFVVSQLNLTGVADRHGYKTFYKLLEVRQINQIDFFLQIIRFITSSTGFNPDPDLDLRCVKSPGFTSDVQWTKPRKV